MFASAAAMWRSLCVSLVVGLLVGVLVAMVGYLGGREKSILTTQTFLSLFGLSSRATRLQYTAAQRTTAAQHQQS